MPWILLPRLGTPSPFNPPQNTTSIPATDLPAYLQVVIQETIPNRLQLTLLSQPGHRHRRRRLHPSRPTHLPRTLRRAEGAAPTRRHVRHGPGLTPLPPLAHLAQALAVHAPLPRRL
jgi:hypothetical protein